MTELRMIWWEVNWHTRKTYERATKLLRLRRLPSYSVFALNTFDQIDREEIAWLALQKTPATHECWLDFRRLHRMYPDGYYYTVREFNAWSDRWRGRVWDCELNTILVSGIERLYAEAVATLREHTEAQQSARQLSRGIE